MLSSPKTDVYTDFNGLAKLKNQAKKESPEAVREVAKQFESIFLNNVLKTMREAKLADGIMDSDQTKFFNDMYDQQLALHLSSSPGIGLADLIVRQLSRNEQPAQNKQDTEDFLNRSGGVSRNTPVQARAVNRSANAGRVQADSGRTVTAGQQGQASTMTFRGSGNAFEPITEFPSKSDAGRNSSVQSSGAIKGSNDRPIQSADDFVRRLYPIAVRVADELGVEPRVLIAQAALETGWGRSIIKHRNGDSSFNLFNIKAGSSWQGRQTRVASLEFDQGVARKVNSGFRAYDSYEESFRDYVNLIKNNPRYTNALKNAGNAERYVHELQRAGYATDPRYANKVLSIYQSSRLSDYEPDVIVAMNESAG